MKKNNFTVRYTGIIIVMLILFIITLAQVSSEEKVRISELEKEEINKDDGSQELLREYYGSLLGYVGTNAKFNNIATKDNIAIINVTINGRDRRILTKLHTGNILSTQQDITNAKLIRTENLVVLGNISLKGLLFSEVDSLYGSRRLFGVESTTLRYVDEGVSRLINGEAKVSINPILAELIFGYNVFLSAYGLTQGLYVAEKSNAYFVVKSLNKDSNVGFSWMLSGLRNNHYEGHLVSLYGKEKNIEITATIDYENGSTYVKISGLSEILLLVDEATVFITINESDNNQTNGSNNETNNNNQNNNSNNNGNNQGIKLITGNLVDEFGLETDLGGILSETAPELPAIGDDNSNNNNDQNNNLNNDNNIDDNLISNNQTSGEISTLEFVLYSVDEGFIVDQISSATELNSAEVRKLISFVYAEPRGFSDEVIDPKLELSFIEKVNGSVIIKLG